MTSRRNSPSVSIIILNYNGERFIRNCLNSVLSSSHPDFEVIVVDNASGDGSDSIVEKEYPSLRLIRNRKNLGFAGGNNVGIKIAKGDILVLLNNDTSVEEGWLEGLADALLSSENVGIAGSKILLPDRKTIQHAGGIIHPNALTNHYGYGEIDTGQHDAIRDVDYVTGASIGIKREVVEKAGMLNEGYFPAYYEEVELCRRAKGLGYRIVYTPYSVLIHHESSSTKLFSYKYFYYYHKNRVRYVLRNYGPKEFIFSFIPSEISWMVRRCPRKNCMPLIHAYLFNLLLLPSIFFDRMRGK